MMNRQLAALVDLTQTRHRAELGRIRALLDRENRLRSQIAAIDHHRRTYAERPDADLAGLRSVGGDLLWNAWLSRSRQELQNELAHLLATKAEKFRALRRVGGQDSAATDILKAQRLKHQRAIEKRRDEELRDLHLAKKMSD